MKLITCISCNNTYDTLFCPSCGEKSGIKKITFKSIIEDAFTSITSMDKGFLFNIKTLILKPQNITISYILGKRKGILNPVSFLIFSISIYLISVNLIGAPNAMGDGDAVKASSVGSVGYEAGYFITNYLKYFWILTIIPLSLALKLAFRKYNFIEYLALSSFIIGQATLIGIISYSIFRFPLVMDVVVYLVILWLTYRIFKTSNNKIETFFIAFTVLILFIIQLFIITMLIGVLIKYVA